MQSFQLNCRNLWVCALLMLPLSSVRADQAVSPTELPAVEFVKVEGKPCLQPIVHAPQVTFQDYGNAERRWLDETYPGVSATQWQADLILSPAQADGDEIGPVTHVSDTAYLDGVVGPNATVCFDVNFTDTLSPRKEPGAPIGNR
jgi:hypothetical protein